MSKNKEVVTTDTATETKPMKKTTRKKKEVVPLKYRYSKNENIIEAYIDEVGRGCLGGPVTCASVILPNNFPDDIYKQIKDSKKLSEKKREMLYDYIIEHALDYAIASLPPKEVDRINILQATFTAMHNAVDNLSFMPDLLVVDGDKFRPYKYTGNSRSKEDVTFIEHVCIKGGDNEYIGIAAASILAKVSRDRYIKQLCKKHPELDMKYGWSKNKAYGTKQHRDGIKQYGITKYHRKTFGICKNFVDDGEKYQTNKNNVYS